MHPPGYVVLQPEYGLVGERGDIWWEQETAIARQMVPECGATIVNFGLVRFNTLTLADLQRARYTMTPIPGNNDSANQLGDFGVFAVHAQAGNYAKVEVLSYGYQMEIRWVTYRTGSA